MCWIVSRTSFMLSAPTPRSFMILASRRENPIRYIQPSFCGKTLLGLRLISACVRILVSYHLTPCRLTSPCLPQLGTLRDFLSVQSTLPTPLGSARISWYSLCTFWCERRGRHETPGGPEESRWSQSGHMCIRICVQSTHVYIYAERQRTHVYI